MVPLSGLSRSDIDLLGCPQLGLNEVFLSHPICFPFLFSLQHPLFSSLFSRGNRQFFGSEPSLRLVWAQNQPNFRPNRQNAGNFAENPCIPGNYPATGWVFCMVVCRVPRFRLRFCPRPALRLRETRELPEWSTKHPLVSLEISGNAKCWGPSRFLFGFRARMCLSILFPSRQPHGGKASCVPALVTQKTNGRRTAVRPRRPPRPPAPAA